LPYISYNTDDSIILNTGISFTLHNFDTKDYSSIHSFQVGASFEGSFGLEYNGRFHHIYNGWDLTLHAHYDNPLRYTYFYGFGNESIKDEATYSQEYYRNRFGSKGVSVGVIKDFWKKSFLTLSAKYDHNERQEKIANTIFANYNIVGIDKANILEGTTSLLLDFTDNKVLPSSGTSFYAEYNNGFVTNLEYKNYGKLLLVGKGYISIPDVLPITFGLIAGGGKSFGKIPFYNQFKLGQNNYLKGYTNNRFTGTSIAFAQTGFRIDMLGISGPLVPMNIGLLGFFNAGRVFQSGEISNKWHNSYGGGFYIVPLMEEFTIYTTISFSEEESMLFEFGLGSGL
jgi:hypothetical protein